MRQVKVATRLTGLTGNEDMDTQSKTSLGSSPSDGEPFVEDQSMEPSVDNTGNHDGGSSGQGSGHVVGHVGHGNSHVVVGHDGGGQSSENQGYGPIRQTPLTQALRRSLDNLDFGHPRLPQSLSPLYLVFGRKISLCQVPQRFPRLVLSRSP